MSELKFNNDKLNRKNDINRQRIDELVTETQNSLENKNKFQLYTDELVSINEQLVKRVNTLQDREKRRTNQNKLEISHSLLKPIHSSRSKSADKQKIEQNLSNKNITTPNKINEIKKFDDKR